MCIVDVCIEAMGWMLDFGSRNEGKRVDEFYAESVSPFGGLSYSLGYGSPLQGNQE